MTDVTDGRDEAILEWVVAKVQQFLDHVQEHHPQDHRVVSLTAKLKAVRLLAEDEAAPRNGSWRNGKFKHSTGVLYVAGRTPKGQPRPPSSLLKTVVHELAHATRYKEDGETSHSPQWKQTWLWFLSIATKELGWKVDIKCAECTYYGLCDRQQCPKCNWLQTLCKPYAGPPE